MKKLAILAIAILSTALPVMGQTVFSTTLSGSSETTICDQDGTGLAVVTVDGTTVTYLLLVQNIGTVTGAHIHKASIGVDGPIVVDFAPTFAGGNASGSVTVGRDIIDEIVASPENFYVNVHTPECSAGAIRGQLAGGTRDAIVFPIVGSGPGAGGTQWVTDLRVLNQGGAAVDVTLKFYAQSSTGLSGPTAISTISVPAGRQMVLDNVIQSQLGLGQFGALELVATGEVRGDARILNDRRGNAAGTAGFAIEGFDLDDASTAGALPLLSQGIDFRTNVGYFNPSSQSTQLTLTARSTADGSVLGQAVIAVDGYEQAQQGVFGLISSVPESQRLQENFYVTWSSDAPMFVYGSVVDNITGDSVYIE